MSVNEPRRIIRYSNSFKLKVVREVESGCSFNEVRKKYDISGTSTVQQWTQKYGKHHLLNKIVRVETMTDKDRLKELERENKLLKQKLAETFMAKECLNEVIKLADKEFRTDLKKNFGTQSPANSRDSSV